MPLPSQRRNAAEGVVCAAPGEKWTPAASTGVTTERVSQRRCDHRRRDPLNRVARELLLQLHHALLRIGVGGKDLQHPLEGTERHLVVAGLHQDHAHA